MPRQPDLFGPRPRSPSVVRMHAVDVGQAPGMLPGWRTATGADFTCRRCGHQAGWLFNLTISEIRRGVPCPMCNPEESDDGRGRSEKFSVNVQEARGYKLDDNTER